MSWTSNIKNSPRARADRIAFRWAMRRKFRKKFSPEKAAPQHVSSQKIHSDEQTVSRVGNSRSTESPANSISKP